MKAGIRRRVTAASTLALLFFIALAGSALVLKVRRDLRASLDDSLRSRAGVITSAANISGSAASLIEKDEAFAQVLTEGGVVTASSADFVDEPLMDAGQIATLRDLRFFERTLSSDEDTFPARLLATRLKDGSILVVGSSIEDEQEAVRAIIGALLIGSPILTAIAGFIVWQTTGAALRPVERLREEADALSMSEMGRPLPVPETDDEIARLGHSLNSLLGRLDDAFTKERRFLDEASHEMRTPVSTLKAELELALTKGSTYDDLRAAIERALSDADYLSLLTEDLLVMARTDDGRLPLRQTDVDLAELTTQVALGFEARAGSSGSKITVDAAGTAHVDPLRIRQVLNNLIDNALRHGHPGSVVTIRTDHDEGGLVLIVEDNGPGFGSRSPAGGGGLGLRIVRTIIAAHGGEVQTSDREGGGARVTLRLPV